MKNKMNSIRIISFIVLFFVVIIFIGYFFKQISYKSNETDKWGYYNYDEDYENKPFNLFENYDSFESSLGVIISNEWYEYPIVNNEILVELLEETKFFSYKKSDLLDIDKEVIYGKYKTITIRPTNSNHYRRFAIILVNSNVYLVRQNNDRIFAIFKADSDKIYSELNEYFNINFRLINQP